MLTFDYIIVGAGSSGAVLAHRLSADSSRSIALLEAGPDYRTAQTPEAMKIPNPCRVVSEPEFSKYRWDTLLTQRTKAQKPALFWRGRGMGGSSAINGQIAIRGVREDYDEWAALGCKGWSFDEVLPAFKRLETDILYGDASYHGNAGPIPVYRAPVSKWGIVDDAFAQAALDEGYPWEPDHNAPGTTGLSPYAINNRNGVRVSTNDAYIEPSRDRKNLSIFGDAHVDKVLFNGATATGVRVHIGDEQKTVYAKTIILSAGSIHSPAILLRSGVGPRKHLEDLGIPVKADLPVGRSLQDHPIFVISMPLAHDRRHPDGLRHTNACVRYSSGFPGAGANDMQMVALNLSGDSLGSNQDSFQQANTGLLGVWVNQCTSRGDLRLHSLDPFDQPLVEENMLDTQLDLLRMRDGVKRLQALLRNPAFTAISEIDPKWLGVLSDEDIDELTMTQVGDAQHPTSTCRMGDPSDPLTVVDSECRVLGLEGLRVIDASIMPNVVRANTHLTAVMIAEHMAEKL